ncbi:MAG: undecaprenyl-diphosphatase UppP [Thermomicrobium sp.]|nr:undecaprenyl-diphosphatase UppP [Thermomicrobium sp.]MDW8059634.1 undecaprenyl-diphosphatase UppP [Thermomicrobium sp.]
MSLWQAIVLGVLQGATEFLPISSSAHLIAVPWLFGWPEPGLAFNVALHLGTLAAVFVYFWRDIARIALVWLRGVFRAHDRRTPEWRLGWAILVGSVPAGVVGVLANDAIDRVFHAGGGGRFAIVLVAMLLIALGVLLWVGERVGTQRRGIEEIDLVDGLAIGVAQAFALLPGVSRSGSTITAGLFRGLDRASAARFSFLLGIPAIVGAGALEVVELGRHGLPPEERAVFLVGVASAAVTGFLAIAFLLRFLQRRSTLVFVVYRLAFGLLLLGMVLAR